MGFMPPRDEFDHYIEVAEKVLTTECRTLLEYVAYKFDEVPVIVLNYCFHSHIHVVSAGFFLARILMRMMSEHGERVDLEFIRRKVEFRYVLVFWSSIHSC